MNSTPYENLVTYRNSLKPKYMAFLRMILEYPLGLGAATDSTTFAFDLENAAGVNLDTIGALVGVDRLLPFVPTVGTREMNDTEYRMLIKLKIARNVWDGRNEPILNIYRSIFPSLNITYMDNQDMTVTLTATGTFDFREAEILAASGYILVPAGVGYTVVTYGGGSEVRLYTAVSHHGELLVDRVVTHLRTWNFPIAKSLTWEDIKKMTWGELLQSNDGGNSGMTWQALKDTMVWGRLKDTEWGTYISD